MNKKLQDLAWSVLPKEFKEEVKKEYAKCVAIDMDDNPNLPAYAVESATSRRALLEMLFGIHNLTSDAEGEEMLTVPRKNVQELYAKAKDIYNLYANATCINSMESSAIDINTGKMKILDTLFGSKCLPDELNEDNFAKSEPKTFKYSVGQKVILHFYGGEVSTITEAFNDGGVWNKYKVKALPTHVWNENELDPYEEPKPSEPDEKDDCKKFTKRLDDTLEGDIKEPFKEWRDKNSSNVEKLEKNGEVEPKPSEPKFKPGDKVLKKDHNYENEGCPYDIFLGYIGHDKGGYLCAVEAHGWIMHESDLEPYTEPEEEVSKMKPIESKMSVYLATKEEDEEFRLLLHKNGFKWHTNTPLINLTCWGYDFEDSKIHYIHPDKTVTYCGEKTSDTLTFSEFKKRYFEENVNLSQNTANCDKQFNNILKDSFSKERRLNIAAMIIQGVMANPYWTEKRMRYAMKQGSDKESVANEFINTIVEDVMELTDALIAEAGKGDKK